MKNRFFDFEVTPNWWLCVFGDMPEDMNEVTLSIKDSFVIVNSDMPNARELLLSMLREEGYCNFGYNIKGYDLIIANGIYQGFSPQQIKIINDIIIDSSSAWSTKEHMRLQPFAKKRLSGIVFEDLMDDGDGSLKEKEAILGLNILESSVDFNKEYLTEQDKEDMTYYCRQDVYAAMIYYKEVVHPYSQTKLLMGKTFNIDEKTCYTSTNARLVALALGAKRRTFSDAEKIEVELPDRIKQYCYDNLPNKIIETILTDTKSFEVKLFNNTVSFGNGGIHSILDNDIYVEANDEWMLVNVDAESYYPSMLIQFNCLSRCVVNPEVFSDIYRKRMEIKHKPNKTKEDTDKQLAYKLVLNTTFGASGNKWLDLYDPHQCTRTCRVGQIFLGALANKLYNTVPGLQIIQTNTDGILCYFRRKDIDLVRKLTGEWTKISGINMEEDLVEKIWQRNVNNYLLIKEGGKLKYKGAWLNNDIKRLGYVNMSPLTAFACSKAAIEFLRNGTDIVSSIFNNKNLSDFVIVCTKGPTYRGVIQRFADGSEKQLFKANRVIATKDKNYGMLYKYKVRLGNISYAKMPNIPENCYTMNDDLSLYDFNEIRKQLDYMYYIERCAGLLDIPWRILDNGELKYTHKFDLNLD